MSFEHSRAAGRQGRQERRYRLGHRLMLPGRSGFHSSYPLFFGRFRLREEPPGQALYWVSFAGNSGWPAALHPALTVAVDLHDRAAAMPLAIFAKPPQEAQVAAIRGPQSAMRNLEEILLDLPDVREGQAPVVPAEGPQIHQLVAGDAAGEVHVRIEVAPHQVANAAEHRFAAVKARVSGPGHRTPPTPAAKHEEHV